ncbi:MAG: protein-tyrosine phosphatase [Psychromonas sp.]|jgi:protein-tyrosine phosphatase|uniref:cyclin-dependent kinase inhibitor 3 family protein n=1 Tax=Psychromonas sp. TaxID=1884585 RepID=UPI0039E6EF1C
MKNTMTHPTWELPLKDNGALILMPCPGTKQVTLLDSLKQLKSQGVTVIITAISQAEMQAKNVGDLGDLAATLGIQWLHLPIEDDCVPDHTFQQDWQKNSKALHARLARGEKIAMHCMGGSGRTGLLAAHLLLERDWALDEIIARVQALRPGAFKKADQIDYVRQLAEK